MKIDDFIDAADSYAALGWSVQAQLKELLDGEDGGLNKNAVDMIREWAKQLPFTSWELTDALERFYDDRAIDSDDRDYTDAERDAGEFSTP